MKLVDRANDHGLSTITDDRGGSLETITIDNLSQYIGYSLCQSEFHGVTMLLVAVAIMRQILLLAGLSYANLIAWVRHTA